MCGYCEYGYDYAGFEVEQDALYEREQERLDYEAGLKNPEADSE